MSYSTVDVDLTRGGVAGSHFEEIDELRESTPAFWNESGRGYWALTRFDDVRDAFQSPALLSNDSIVVTEPNPPFRMMPSNAGPPEHMLYRQTMNAWFAPAAVAKHEPFLRQSANELIDELIGDGGCEFMSTYGTLFPARALVAMMGLPQSETPVLVEMTGRITGSVGATEADARARAAGALDAIRGYFVELVRHRRSTPADPQVDFVSHLLQVGFADRHLFDDEILDICMTLVLGGLRTTRSQMGWCMYHLATNPIDRQQLVDDPSMIRLAIEEFLRAYPIVNVARKVVSDVDFHGCPMKEGQMVLMFVQSANRDPRVFDRADEVVIDRRPNRHIAFGASAHRCLGSHLARAELEITLEEWHRRIPRYRLATTDTLQASGGHIALLELPLAWTVTGTGGAT
jgi:cytochrome P450